MTSTICAAREIQRREVNLEPVGAEWIADLERLFEEKIPEPECPATRAVEGVGHQRVDTNRFQGGEV